MLLASFVTILTKNEHFQVWGRHCASWDTFLRDWWEISDFCKEPYIIMKNGKWRIAFGLYQNMAMILYLT